MIQHIPEKIVPFLEGTYHRTPLQPYVGDTIQLDCICDRGFPILECMGIEVEHIHSECLQENQYRFILPKSTKPCEIQYRFVHGEEKSRWFSADILEEKRYCKAIASGNSWIQLDNSLFLVIEHSKGSFSLRFSKTESGNDFCFDSPWGWKVAENGLWELQKNNTPVLTCSSITLGLREDGSIATQKMYLRGIHNYVYGTGERFDSVNQQGRSSCGEVVEHFTQQGQWAYLPISAFFTDAGYGFFRNSGCSTALHFGNEIEISSAYLPKMVDYFFLGTPAEQLQAYIAQTGNPVLPPEWAFGVWISANGWDRDEEVEHQIQQLKTYDYPASVIVLEAWSDESTFYQWNHTWRNPEKLVKDLKAQGLHVVLWQIPALKKLEDCPIKDQAQKDIEEALKNGYLVKHKDGSAYKIPERWFAGSYLPDFTNPATCDWWFNKRKALLEMGVEGFKTDGGEFLFGSDFALYGDCHGIEAHNLYPMQYIKAYQDWMQASGVQGITFSRAGFSGAQSLPIHWAGDQLSTWEELQAQLRAGISAGLSGILFWSFDIGGFAGELPTPELYHRATAMGCFSPIMQWHAEPRTGQFYGTYEGKFNNDRSPWNLAEKWGDSSQISISTKFARLREELRPYLWEEAQYCVQMGRPMMAHLCLDFPEDSSCLACEDEYMLGRSLLIAPIVQEGANGRMLYLPKGTWRHYFTRQEFEGEQNLFFECPIDEALVFERV